MRHHILSFAAAAAIALPMTAAEPLSGVISNPGFETGNFSGWFSAGFQTQNNNSPADEGWAKEGTYYAEKWVNQGSKVGSASLSQQLSGLAPGDYRVTATGHGVAQNGRPEVASGFFLFAGSARTEISKGGEYSVEGTTIDGNLSIGVCTDNCDANWIAIDNFRIEYLGEDVSSYTRLLDEIVKEAQDIIAGETVIDNADEFANAETLAKDAGTDAAKIRAAIEAYKAAMDNFTALRNSRTLLESEIYMARHFAEDSDYGDKTSLLAAIAEAEGTVGKTATADERRALVANIRKAANDYLALCKGLWVNVVNGRMWYDTDGNPVQAHGAGFVKVYDTWYMIGEDRSNQWHPDVNMYSSKDLVNWKFVKKIIANGTSHPDLGTERMIERPKLMYCPNTGKFVVWCHWEASNYGASEAGVFVSDRVDGEYKFHSGSRPLGIKSRDCNVFVDDDGTAYFISTIEENQHLGLFRLSDDYLEAVECTELFRGQKREAPAIVKVDGIYYMLSSACSGWDPNQCKLSWSESLTSGWSSLKNVGNGTAFDSQAANILTVTGTSGTTYLYVGDRWKDPELPESKTIMFPIDFADGSCTFDYHRSFDFNPAEGIWRETTDDASLDRSGWSVVDCSSQETDKENGAAANVLDGDKSTIWHTNYSGDKGVAPHHITIDMGKDTEIGGMLYTPRNDHSTNGMARSCILQTSTDGENWATVAGTSWLPYWSAIYFAPHTARYFRFYILNSEYGSAAEFDMLGPGASTATPDQIDLYYSLDNGRTWVNGSEINVSTGNSVKLGPSCPATDGTWAMSGPDKFMSVTKEYLFENVAVADAGTYTVTRLAPSGMASTAQYRLIVDGHESSVDTAVAEKEIAETTYYSVDGLRLRYALDRGITIRVIRYTDGTAKTDKICRF